VSLLVFTMRNRPPALRRMAIVEAGCVTRAAALLAALALPHRDEAHARIDCGRFAFDRAAWAAGGTRHDDVARGLDRCHALDGRTAAQVRGLLGPPDGGAPAVGLRYWRYPGLEVYFRGPRIAYAAATSLSG
jgi:hypothetical protein